MIKLKSRAPLLLIALALPACQSLSSVPPVQTICPALPPPDPATMTPREPSFRVRLLQILSSSPERPMRSPDSSGSAKRP